MAVETKLEELMREDTLDANKILSELLDPKNIDMKTHIQDPVTFAILESIVNNLEELLSLAEKTKVKLPLTKKVLKDIISQLKKLLVSYKRLGRIEVTETLQKAKEQETSRSLFDKLAGIR